jgi:uncharacterized protein YeeX (DUF496 family)
MKVPQDQITRLCSRLMKADQQELHPVAKQLRRAIHDQVDRVRENAFEVALVDRLTDYGASGLQMPVEESSN